MWGRSPFKDPTNTSTSAAANAQVMINHQVVKVVMPGYVRKKAEYLEK
jgi:hypothetical protein